MSNGESAQRKTLYIIPGYKGKTNKTGYKKIAALAKKRGFRVVPVDITWKYGTITEYIKQAEKVIISDSARQKYILGFSFGAYISFVLSTRHKFSAQILCSLSPYFQETISRIPRRWKSVMGKRRIAAFRKYSFRALAPKVNCRTVQLYTSKEHPLVEKTERKIAQKLHVRNRVHRIDGIKHNIHRPEYIQAVRTVLQTI